MDKDVYCQQLIVSAKIHKIHSRIAVRLYKQKIIRGLTISFYWL